jgi:hypothetical protein
MPFEKALRTLSVISTGLSIKWRPPSTATTTPLRDSEYCLIDLNAGRRSVMQPLGAAAVAISGNPAAAASTSAFVKPVAKSEQN